MQMTMNNINAYSYQIKQHHNQLDKLRYQLHLYIVAYNFLYVQLEVVIHIFDVFNDQLGFIELSQFLDIWLLRISQKICKINTRDNKNVLKQMILSKFKAEQQKIHYRIYKQTFEFSKVSHQNYISYLKQLSLQQLLSRVESTNKQKQIIDHLLISEASSICLQLILVLNIQSKIMQNSPNSSLRQIIRSSSLECTYLSNLKNQTDLISMYLNQQVFYHAQQYKCEQNNYLSLQKSQQKTQNTLSHSQQCTPEERYTPKHKKSVFHNFQKHLISLIKKYINLAKDRISVSQDGRTAYQIWQAFMKTTSSNKRLLHMVFGVEGQKASKNIMDKLSNDFEEFQKINNKYDYQSIIRAQKIIRQNFVHQASQLSKSFIKSNSFIAKFDEFYEYYLAFIKQVQMGQMSKRMSKVSKKYLIEKLACKASLCEKE